MRRLDDPSRASFQPRAAHTYSMLYLRLTLFVVAGSLAGLGYHRFIGCRSGACPIWANPWASTAYGAVLGYLLSGFGR